jgi:hypothetical protein
VAGPAPGEQSSQQVDALGGSVDDHDLFGRGDHTARPTQLIGQRFPQLRFPPWVAVVECRRRADRITSDSAASQRRRGNRVTSGGVGVRSKRGRGGSTLRRMIGAGDEATSATTGTDFLRLTRKP